MITKLDLNTTKNVVYIKRINMVKKSVSYVDLKVYNCLNLVMDCLNRSTFPLLNYMYLSCGVKYNKN